MRPPVFRAAFEGELTFDFFAGGGGASSGIEQALGRPVDIAINHSATAIAMHKANHPETKHFTEDVWEVDPMAATGGRPVGLAWFSPDCCHFSRAKGAQPRKQEIRGLAWVVVRWAKAVRPRVILLENVDEFSTWGPLDESGRPHPERSGETFREWIGQLTALGYAVEYRSLVAADYGAPTTRRRLFLQARCDGQPITWPEATHGRGRAQGWRPAAEIIDWALPCPSIFGRKKPLAEATLNRIAKGLERYVFGAAEPFVIPLTHQGDSRVHGVGDPLRTITAAHRGELALVEPFVVRHGHYSTITGAGLREGCGAGTFRGQSLDQPLGTVCATNDKHLVLPIVTKHYGGVVGHEVTRALGTVTAKDHHALTAAFLTKYHGGTHQALRGQSLDEPLRTVDTANRFAAVQAFLIKYYGTGGPAQTSLPLDTVTSKARFGLVVIRGESYQLVDIGMRMLQPRELFAAQGFPEDYDITTGIGGKPLTKTEQTALAGNSVCPPAARALVEASARAA